MKKSHFLLNYLFLIFCLQGSIAQTYNGNLTINDQAALDNFSYVEVTGILLIEAIDTINNKIIDLSPLASLKIVGGGFGLTNIHASNYSSLNNLEYVGNGLFFENCKITDLTFLTNLTYLDGFSAMHMHGLTSLDGLQFMTSSRYFYLYNLGITNFQGLNNLQEVGTFRFHPNSLGGILQSCDGLQSLKKAEIIDIRATAPFTSLGLNNLDTVEVLYFHQLSTFSYMDVESVDYIYCNDCTMTDFQGLEKVKRLGDYNTTDYGGLWIQFGYNLTSTIGLENLTHAKFIIINGCPTLEELNFENLDSVGSLSIVNNPILESTSKMQSLSFVDSGLGIANNYSLIDCCAFEEVLSLPGLNINISNNPFPCNNVSSISTECSSVAIWTGAAGTSDWNTPMNWSNNMDPEQSNPSTIIIPSTSSSGFFPIINNSDAIINKLAIGQSAEMILDGQTLQVISTNDNITISVLGKLTLINDAVLIVGYGGN